jgi:recombination protein RecA
MGIEEALKHIEKAFGKEAVIKLTAGNSSIERVSTGSIGLDIATGGGLPRGRIIEIYGPEMSGKTTLSYHIIAEVQKLGGEAAFIDAEHSLDPDYAQNIGVNLDKLYISQPNTGEEALEIVDTFVKEGAVDVVIVDSVSALVPRAEIDGEMGDSHIGLQARLMSQAMRKLSGGISRSNTIVVFINQIRMKIGVFFGNPETTSGGQALKFYSTIRIDLRRSEQLKEGDRVTGNRVKAKVVKNKVAPPFRTAEFDIIYGEGISYYGELVDLGVEKRGSWLDVCGKQMQGKLKAIEYIKENPKVEKELRDKITNQQT